VLRDELLAELAGIVGPDEAAEWAQNSIDTSALAIGNARRYRDKTHLRFVAKEPCLICGRKPCDPHHLRFAQSCALGRQGQR
jgi:hypothetical protein